MDDTMSLPGLVARLALLVTAFMALSTLLSFFVRAIARLLIETSEALARVAKRVVEATVQRWSRFRVRFWDETTREPKAPIASELAVLANAAQREPATEVRRLERLGRQLDTCVSQLRETNATLALARQGGTDAVIAAARSVQPGLFAPILLVVMMAAFGAMNAFLLHLFFREAIGAIRLLPYPMPALEVSHALAALFVFLEVAAGIVLHHFESESEHTSGAARLLGLVPGLVILVLLFIEIVAYSALSSTIDLPSKLGISSSSAFYGMTKYFLAGFGAVLTLILSALGYMASLSFRRYAAARRERAAVRAVRDLQGTLEKVDQQATEVDRRLVSLRNWSWSFHGSLPTAFRAAVGTDSERSSLAVLVRERIAAVFALHAEAGQENSAVLRTKGQVLADIALGAVAGVVWFALLALCAGLVRRLIIEGSGTVEGWQATAAGWVVAAAVALFGYLLRGSFGSARYASDASAVAIDATSRRAVALAAAIGLVLALVIFSVVAANRNLVGTNDVVNAALGALLILALGAASLLIESVTVAFLRIGQAVYQGLACVTMLTVALLANVVQLLLFVVRQSLLLLAIPGDWIRSRLLLAGDLK